MENHCIFEILTWLPPKSLMRFTPISKSWNTLIRHDPNFVKSHISHSQPRLLFELEVRSHCKEELVTKLNKKRRSEGFPLKLLTPRHYFCNKEMIICSNHCNGLVCLYSYKKK
ncbi:hypothetical protein HAX54_038924 [Datura stramonium]|uniref:F-box domain-containing protein n=1 Tax=Datura stramonium TaxID=4076 RepID=A0ABS8SII2_DATST|nr:hypothetical protein [Datura stramonium]